jgi:hypothetical protein
LKYPQNFSGKIKTKLKGWRKWTFETFLKKFRGKINTKLKSGGNGILETFLKTFL